MHRRDRRDTDVLEDVRTQQEALVIRKWIAGQVMLVVTNPRGKDPWYS
jgi:hypothetical protein